MKNGFLGTNNSFHCGVNTIGIDEVSNAANEYREYQVALDRYCRSTHAIEFPRIPGPPRERGPFQRRPITFHKEVSDEHTQSPPDRTITVTTRGRICLGRRKLNLSVVFAGQNVGVKEVSDKI